MQSVNTALVVIALLLAGMPLGAQAQQGLDEIEILLDDATDAQFTVAGQLDAPDGDRFDQSDLVGLFIQEGSDDITFRMQVADAAPEDGVFFVEQGEIVVEFMLGAVDQYAIELYHDDGNYNAYLSKWDPVLERYVRLMRMCDNDFFCEGAMSIDPALDSWVIPVPRDYLLDSQGAAIHPGLPMHSFFVTSVGGFQFIRFDDQSGTATTYDQMPDDGQPAGAFKPVIGVQQTGHLFLDSPAPVRASNGEATTYVYDVTLDSSADFVDDVELTIVGAPTNWQVKLPADNVRIDNETTIDFPVLVTTPFGHMHGSFESFIVEAHSARDPSAVGRVELGVRYTDIPQPAGHHSLLWLHSASDPSNAINEACNTVGPCSGGSTHAYFNAASPDDDPRDEGIDVRPDSASICTFNAFGDTERPSCMTYGWEVHLEPTLSMGLDFDVNGTGSLSVPFLSPVPLQAAYVEGTLYYLRAEDAENVFFPEEDALVLGRFAPSDLQSISAGQTITFDTTFTPTPEADFLLYEPDGATVWMEVELTALAVSTFFADGATEPLLAPGGELELPLNEYHDPVDDLYVKLTDVDVLMESDQEQYVNSGETILFEVRFENTGVVNDRFQVILGGHNEEWATILGDTEFSIRSHESRRVVVAVTAPLATNQGDTADLVLEAISKSDDNARALVRLYAEVDNFVDHEDKAHLVPVTSEELTYTPVGQWLAPLALLGALLVLRRSRHL